MVSDVKDEWQWGDWPIWWELEGWALLVDGGHEKVLVVLVVVLLA